MNATKLIVTSEKNLRTKYGDNFSILEKLLRDLIKSDKKKKINTSVVYVDNKQSAKKAGVTAVKMTTAKECKGIVDKLYHKNNPDYIVILGAQDVFPFQPISNPASEDGDEIVDSDLPYACDTPYSRSISSFTGPTRVVGRIPDIPGKNDPGYLRGLIRNIIKHRPVEGELYKKYFSVSASVWRKSTELSLLSMFGDNGNLLLSPKAAPKTGYAVSSLKPMIHFYNCHGALGESKFYGQRGNSYPVALDSNNLTKMVTYGTVVAAECCYGAELIDPVSIDSKTLSIANAYLKNQAIAFLGSSTIAYGPEDSQGLADLITQYFIISLLNGASAGRALLEARQRFLTVNGPQLDPYELKTLAQFYLLGDPSIRPVASVNPDMEKSVPTNTTRNDRKNLYVKGINLKNSIAPSKRINNNTAFRKRKKLKELLKSMDFEEADATGAYEVKSPGMVAGLQKKLLGQKTKFHTFVKHHNVVLKKSGRGKSGHRKVLHGDSVLVVKEDQQEILGWRIYVTR